MDILSVVVLVVACFAGAVLGGITGWGGWILCGSLAWLVLDPYTALIVAQPVCLGLDVTLVLRERGFISYQLAKRLVLWTIPGLALGAVLLAVIGSSALQIVAGVLILGAAAPIAWTLFSGRQELGGIVAGVFTLIGGFNGPPLAMSISREKLRVRRGTLGVVFIFLAAATVPLAFVAVGSSSGPRAEIVEGLKIGTVLLPISVLGTLAGLHLSRWKSVAERIVPISRAICIFAGLALIIRTLV